MARGVQARNHPPVPPANVQLGLAGGGGGGGGSKSAPPLPAPPGYPEINRDISTSATSDTLGEAQAVVMAFVQLDEAGGSLDTYELVAPSNLLWSMREFVSRQLLERIRAAQGGRSDRKHTRCHFSEAKHGHAIQVLDGGMRLQSGASTPRSALSSVCGPSGMELLF